MRYKLTVALGYFALMAWIIYGVIDPGHDVSDTAGVIIMFVLPVALGLMIGRWWAALLPVSVFLISFPAGYSADSSAELPIWFGAMFVEGIAIPLVLAGVLTRKLGEHFAPGGPVRRYPSAPGTARPGPDPRD